MEGSISNSLRYVPYFHTACSVLLFGKKVLTEERELQKDSVVSVSCHRIAVVTGGNRGIGLEVCRQLANNGITVVLTAIDEEMAAEAVEKLKVQGLFNVLSHELDITNTSSVARLADFLKTHFGKLDILVNRPSSLSN